MNRGPTPPPPPPPGAMSTIDPTDRSGLFKELGGFSQRKLKNVQMKVVTGTGETLQEKRGIRGVISAGAKATSTKKDLQVGLVTPGIMIGCQDVAHDKVTLQEYGVTHILNLSPQTVPNLFPDSFTYLSLDMKDADDTFIPLFFPESFKFLDSSRCKGNCFIHCDSSKPGLSRSTAICIGYLMEKEEKSFQDAWTSVKEARSFVRPRDSFMEQLKLGPMATMEMVQQFIQQKKQQEQCEPSPSTSTSTAFDQDDRRPSDVNHNKVNSMDEYEEIDSLLNDLALEGVDNINLADLGIDFDDV